jgi:hypothetical protein
VIDEGILVFDAPDLSHVCIAPFVAICVGALVFVIGSAAGLIIGRGPSEEAKEWSCACLSCSVFIVVPIACVASIALQIGLRPPAPWFAPTTGNIVGKWELTSGTIEVLQDWHDIVVPTHELVFNADGTFHVNNVPAFWGLSDSTGTENDGYMSGSGTWYLGQVEGTQRLEWAIFAQFQVINGQSAHRLMRFYFEGHLPPYNLITLEGDSPVIFRFQRK